MRIKVSIPRDLSTLRQKQRKIMVKIFTEKPLLTLLEIQQEIRTGIQSKKVAFVTYDESYSPKLIAKNQKILGGIVATAIRIKKARIRN